MPKGIPHSVFLGRVVGPGDPQWLPEDQDKALAWVLREQGRCHSCGTHPEDWLDEEGFPFDPPPWEATSQECLGCISMDEVRKEIPDGKVGINVYLTAWGTVRRIADRLKRTHEAEAREEDDD